ncbi:MAG: corrinoid protein [Deltaproteobacteria bacterium]|nr:corrinoid protein [Deltaproteobacteria bacterium]MBW2122002.1 corrinoid protein [Deltaproteobacteria bacterium]
MSELYGKISEVLIAGNIEEVKKLTQQALDEGSEAHEILSQGLLPGMDIVGQRFKAAEMFIPEVLRSAKTMHAAMEILRPLLSESDAAGAGTVIMGTVEGDLHDIGKNLVGMMLEGAGFKVVDLGADVKPQSFVEAAKEHKPNILGMSALLTTTMPKMGETINALKEAGIRDQIKVMAGGAPVTQDFVEEIGADAYGSNATAAVEKAKELVGK